MNNGNIFAEAIVRQLRVSAVYNKGRVVLAPHILYRRNDNLYIDAVTIERDGAPPREMKLGTFKLDGLGDSQLAPHGFEPFEGFSRSDPKYEGATLLAIEA